MLILWGLYWIGRRIFGFLVWIEFFEYINCLLCIDIFFVILNYDFLNCVLYMCIWFFKWVWYFFWNFVLKWKYVVFLLEYFFVFLLVLFIYWKYIIVWNYSYVILGWGYGLGLWGRSRGYVIIYFFFIKRNIFWGSWFLFLCEYVWVI